MTDIGGPSIIDIYINRAHADKTPLAAIMASPDWLEDMKRNCAASDWTGPNAYRGVPIEVHDEWSWGWLLRAADGSFVEMDCVESARLLTDFLDAQGIVTEGQDPQGLGERSE